MKVIDFHAHVLPCADHGSDSLETTRTQMELSALASVDTIVATPHFYPHRHKLEDFLARREAAKALLSDKEKRKILLGAEVLLCDNLDKLPGLSKLCIESTRTILLELPFNDFKNSYVEVVSSLLEQGYAVVLAHAERYKCENINALREIGAKIQLNAAAVAAPFMKRHIKEWIASGDVVALGSDIHMADKSAYKRFLKAKKKLGREFENIMEKTNGLIKQPVAIAAE